MASDFRIEGMGREEELKKKLDLAEKLGLSEEEKAKYLSENSSNVERSIAPAEPTGIGPVKDGNKYGSLLSALKDRTKEAAPTEELLTEEPTGGLKEKLVQPLPEEKTPVVKPEEVKTPSLQELLSKETGAIAAERLEAKREKDEELRRANLGQLASMIGRGLAQIGAGISGMRAGVDLSGVGQQQLVNWDAKRQEIIDSYKETINGLNLQQQALVRKAERAEDKAERAAAQAQANAARQEELRFRKEAKQAELDLKERLALVSAAAKGDAEAQKKIEDKANASIKGLEKERNKLNSLEDLFGKYEVADGATKKKLDEKIRGQVQELLGPEATAEVPKEILGFKYSSKQSIDDLIESTRKAKLKIDDQINLERQSLNGIAGMRQRVIEQAAPAPAQQQPAAPAGQTPGLIDMVAPDGRPLKVPAERVAEMEAKGARRK